jgi:putative peptide zinc metalloprotease protein
MDFVSGVTWRQSKRGLVVCGSGGSSLLIDHERADDLPALVEFAWDMDDLWVRMGGSDADRQLVTGLVAERIVAESSVSVAPQPEALKRVQFTRSGVEFTGIDGMARTVHKIVMPVLSSWLGRIAIAAVLIGGALALIVGRPDGPQVSAHPWVDATVGLLLGFALGGMHELAHAVALVHYGRTPRSAGCGFYWGALYFYVDSSDGITLPRRAASSMRLRAWL